MSRQASLRIFSVCSAVALLASSGIAAPAVTNISPRGLQIGGTTTVVITGSELSAGVRLVSELPIAEQKAKPGAKSNRVELEVTLDASTPPGLYAVRAADDSGISPPVVVGVDRLPQMAFGASLDELPAAYSGTVGGAQVLQATLPGNKGQRVVIDVEAQRLGSGLKPVIRLSDPRGTQIAYSPPRAVIGGDARLETILPADAAYTIELHDELFRPAGAGFFRLKVGDLQYADLALPLGVSAGSKQQIGFASTNVSVTAELDATAVHVPGETAAPRPAAETFTGAAPRVVVSDFPELVEANQAGGALQELPPAPAAVSGRLASAGEEDRYLIAVKPGQKLRFDVTARQFGSPLDGVLTIRKPDGGQLATGDDRAGSSDPLVDFTVPKGVTKLELAIKDLLGRGGSDFVYRIAVRDNNRPDFALSLGASAVHVPAGGTQVIPIQITRANYNGPIEFALSGAPPEIALEGTIVPPGATIGLLTISAERVSPLARLTRVVGRAIEVDPPLLRAARGPELPGSRYQPRIQHELGLAITPPAPIGLAWLPGGNDQLFLGGKLPARVQFTRAEGTKGKIRLKLLSSQPTPKKTVKQGNQDRVVDDLDRTLRLEGEPVFGPDQTEVTVNVLVPGDLPKQPWDLVLVAELLSADGKSIVTSLASPVRTLMPVPPFTLALTGDSKAEGKAGAGPTGKLAGRIHRSPGYSSPVVVTLDGLPSGYTPPQLYLPADHSEFELPLTFAYANKPGEVKGKLVAYSAPVEARSVKSEGVDVSIHVVQGDKPPAERPKEIFEDDEQFITLLTEGGGRAIPDQRDQYSGKYSLRVTPDQKFNPHLPNLGVKIRENPGPGEFRYIRFAWKKAQGNAVCLQLAHDGKFGPASGAGGREGASFRYHAGPASDCYGASLQVSDKLPARFELVTRDLFADFGEFTLTGLAFSPVDGQAALFDHLYLARQPEDFQLVEAGK